MKIGCWLNGGAGIARIDPRAEEVRRELGGSIFNEGRKGLEENRWRG
ncbi:hypothetical protein Ferp_2155 [Ferroglobus placidus DSM 10642]|uniref:Uncharacterized protein n=1 Tax=Ferroglobus placidus (strain DSM 10642 / AEDII12DO) TaxID=589924 RepID=D3S0P5_FERPA|nr:hypothetical protein Ferp_2155 [Ferroglobus placidus DSM 10642]